MDTYQARIPQVSAVKVDEALKQPLPPTPLFEWTDGNPSYHGIHVQTHRVQLNGCSLRVVGLKDAADLLDRDEFAKKFIDEDKAPYGFELWPGATMLADWILRYEPGDGRSALDLGCGLGLASIAATARGWRTTAADYERMALQFAEYNAGLNDVAVYQYLSFDWNAPPRTVRYQRVFGADVLYQRIDHIPILECLKVVLAKDGLAVLADPNRTVADSFEALTKERGFHVEIEKSRCVCDGKSIEGRVFLLQMP